MSEPRNCRVVWMIERRPLRGTRNWRAIEWPRSDRDGKEKVAQYNRLIADCEYRLTRYELRNPDAKHFSDAVVLLRGLLESFAGGTLAKKELAWLNAEQRFDWLERERTRRAKR